MSALLFRRYGEILVEIDRLKAEAAEIKKRLFAGKPREQRNTRLRGVQQRVAVQLGLSPATVKAVAAGRDVSDRITKALVEEKNRLGVCGKKYRKLPGAILAECGLGGRYQGVFSTAGRAAGVSANSVRRAAMGVTGSQICLAALYKAIAEVDGNPPTDRPRTYSKDELQHFKHGGRWYGLMAQVARKEKVGVGSVSSAASGKSKSHRLLQALRLVTNQADSKAAGGGL